MVVGLFKKSWFEIQQNKICLSVYICEVAFFVFSALHVGVYDPSTVQVCISAIKTHARISIKDVVSYTAVNNFSLVHYLIKYFPTYTLWPFGVRKQIYSVWGLLFRLSSGVRLMSHTYTPRVVWTHKWEISHCCNRPHTVNVEHTRYIWLCFLFDFTTKEDAQLRFGMSREGTPEHTFPSTSTACGDCVAAVVWRFTAVGVDAHLSVISFISQFIVLRYGWINVCVCKCVSGLYYPTS